MENNIVVHAAAPIQFVASKRFEHIYYIEEDLFAFNRWSLCVKQSLPLRIEGALAHIQADVLREWMLDVPYGDTTEYET